MRFLSSRTGEKRRGRRALVHPAAEHEHHLAGKAARLPEIMGREHDFHAGCGDLRDYVFHRFGGGGIKIRGRLVEKQNFRIAGELLDLVGLAALGARPARRLSGGEQQRLALARAD